MSVESFIVKIHHRNGGESLLMIGEVEGRDGRKNHAFRTAEELWWILLTETGFVDSAPPPKPGSGASGA